MDLLQKEYELSTVLYECIGKIKSYENSKGLKPDKEVKLFESYIISMHNEYNDMSESVKVESPIKVNNPKNIYSYLNNVLKYLNESDTRVMRSLNESASKLSKTANNNFGKQFITYIKNYIKILSSNDDFSNYDKKIIKIKKTLNRPLNVFGFSVNDFSEVFEDIETIIYDTIHHYVVIKTPKGYTGYDIVNDEYKNLLEFYKDKIHPTELSFLESKIGVRDVDIYQLLISTVHRNFITLYRNQYNLGLKYTDNLYKDAAQRAAIADIQKYNELKKSHEALSGIMNRNF